MPITNSLPTGSHVVQEIKPVVNPAPIPDVKPENGLKVGIHGGLKYAKPGGNPATGSVVVPPPLVNGVPQTTLPYPPNNSYLCNAIR